MLNPYNLEPYQQGLRFVTERGVIYYLYFTDVSDTFGGVPVYDFSFAIIGDPDPSVSKKKLDPRIAQTICHVLDNFLTKNDHVILYVPIDDDKGANTSRLKVFDGWFEKFKEDFECPLLEKDKLILRYGDYNFVVTVFYKAHQRKIAEQILHGDIISITDNIFSQK